MLVAVRRRGSARVSPSRAGAANAPLRAFPIRGYFLLMTEQKWRIDSIGRGQLATKTAQLQHVVNRGHIPYNLLSARINNRHKLVQAHNLNNLSHDIVGATTTTCP